MRPTYIPGRLRWNQVLAGAGFVTILLVAASPFSPQAAAAVVSPPVAASAKPTVAPSASIRATTPAARTTSASAQATTPAAAGEHTPALSIGVTDGTNTAKPGDLLSYTVNIRNLGSANAPPLEVALMLPPAFKLLSASADGAKAAGQVKWHVNLPAGHSGAFRVVGRVGDTPRQLLRLDAIACATTGKGAKPIVCAAASNELPAGAAAAAHARLAAAPSANHLIRYVLVTAAAVVLLLVLAGVALMARRRLTTNKGARSSQ
jgi:uncharacterized repeat protein (TIGR01451 family)